MQNLSQRPLIFCYALLPTWLGVFWLAFRASWFWNHRPDLQFGWVVLALSGFLLMDRWSRLPPPRFKVSWLVLLASGIGFLTLTLFQIYQATYGLVASGLYLLGFGVLSVSLANIVFVFGTPGLGVWLFPLAFLFIALPLPSGAYNAVVATLQAAVAQVDVEILNLLGIPASKVGALIQLPGGVVGVDEACSGIRSLQSSLMASLFIGYLLLKRTSLRVALAVIGVATAILGNLIRCLYLSIIANSKGLEAVRGVHDSAGWSILVATALVLTVGAFGISRAERWLESKLAKTLC